MEYNLIISKQFLEEMLLAVEHEREADFVKFASKVNVTVEG